MIVDPTTVGSHIQGMMKAFHEVRQRKAGGIHGKVISNEILRKGCMALVVSQYERRYATKAWQVAEKGTNTKQLVK